MSSRLIAFVLFVTIPATGVILPSREDPYVLREESAGALSKAAVVVLGIDAENLRKLSELAWPVERWAELLSVRIGSTKGADSLPVAGNYRIVDDSLRFGPRFPFEPGLVHRVEFAPSRLPVPNQSKVVTFSFEHAEAPKPLASSVVRVEPSGAVLPENLLKIYIHFSAPMSRGEVYDRVHLRDASGRKVERAFLEIGEELWDPSGTRITLLLDPGRIKRGLRPREEEGPILEEGRTYTIEVESTWNDVAGQPLQKGYVRSFRAGPPDAIQPDPKTWTMSQPAEGSREALRVDFPEPLDHAMLERALVVHDEKGQPLAGKITVALDSTGWGFRPDSPWRPGPLTLVVDPELEDLAGNSIARPFEVDAEGPQPPANAVRLPIILKAKRP